MRRLLVMSAAGLALATGPAAAQEVTASGSLGAGVFDGQAASSLEIGLDLAGAGYAVGFGAGARWLAEDGFRGEEWDEASEWARLLRYALYRWPSEEEAAVSAALGELGGATLGHGALIDGYAGGLDVDHGRTGAQLGAALGRFGGELLIDDVVAPRIAGARLAMRTGRRLVLGASVAGDRAAPATDGDRTAGGVALDAELGAGSGERRGALYADLVHLVEPGASGAHAGARGQLTTGALLIGGRIELRAGSDRYLPGWIGPLYERDRRELASADGTMTGGQLEAARAGGLGGLGTAAQIEVEVIDAGSAAVGYAGRPGVSDLVSARLSAPHWRALQTGFWAAAEIEEGEAEAMAMALELRVRLPGRMFVRGEAARLYREDPTGAYQPIWLAQIALGSVVGEPPVSR